MTRVTKIATCCYCGTRAVLTLAGKVRHELACSACGAPLKKMAHMPVQRAPEPKYAPVHGAAQTRRAPKKAKKVKKKARKLFGEAFDLLEDLFD